MISNKRKKIFKIVPRRTKKHSEAKKKREKKEGGTGTNLPYKANKRGEMMDDGIIMAKELIPCS